MPQPAESGKRFTKARMERVQAHSNSQAGMASKKQISKTRKAFSKDLFRAMDRARKQRHAANTPKRASRQQQGNKDEKKADRRVNKVVDTLVKGHLNIRKADEAVIRELQERLKESQDDVKHPKEDEKPPYEQEDWEVPMLPDHLIDTVFAQVGTDDFPSEELLNQAPGAHFY